MQRDKEAVAALMREKQRKGIWSSLNSPLATPAHTNRFVLSIQPRRKKLPKPRNRGSLRRRRRATIETGEQQYKRHNTGGIEGFCFDL